VEEGEDGAGGHRRNRRLEQAVELAREVDRDAGMHRSLLVEEAAAAGEPNTPSCRCRDGMQRPWLPSKRKQTKRSGVDVVAGQASGT
jgi:hypothetical protein